MKKLTIVIPVYFNQDSLPELFEKLLDVEQQLIDIGIELELIFVDDGSEDNSFQELMKIKKNEKQPGSLNLQEILVLSMLQRQGFGLSLAIVL